MSPHINMLVLFNKKGHKRGEKVEEHLTNMRKMSPENFQPTQHKTTDKKNLPKCLCPAGFIQAPPSGSALIGINHQTGFGKPKWDTQSDILLKQTQHLNGTNI